LIHNWIKGTHKKLPPVHHFPESFQSDCLLSDDLKQNEADLKKAFQNCSDIVFRTIPLTNDHSILLVYIDGLIDARSLERNFLDPLLMVRQNKENLQITDLESYPFSKIQKVEKLNEVVKNVLKANIAILIDQDSTALIVSMVGVEKRQIQEPRNEAAIRGPRDGFTENLRVNTTLLRKRVVTSSFKMESFFLGDATQTETVVAYMEGRADTSVLEMVKERIQKINEVDIIDSGQIENYIQDDPFSPFVQILNTERPDVATASLLEGKIIIISDGSPSVLILPITFWSGLQASEDYYDRYIFSIARRWVRYTMMIISLVLPSLYVALTAYNPDMLPETLMTSIAAARERTPFPTLIETTLMEFIFEGLQEAGVRLPGQLGPLVAIVGALVVGEAAVRAGIISAPVVIVVAITGIASYTFPRYSFSLPFRLLRFFLLFMSGILGIFGIAAGLSIIFAHMLMIESFGTPYFFPIAPFDFKRIKDVVLRKLSWKK
jgi:spore germination protein